ncbi:serine hydrolase [Chryseolinea sp. Jin1]|uniref:beta-lactamase n=2 Tax=Chryseolinea lacunae TaxID=2801331 RepID=A0ABS1KUG6_9BACT|nr:serine hydrolase [Chryseolinea lacunae]MBL0742943.1 serine hydrolase [Chryseolinea lacunae]
MNRSRIVFLTLALGVVLASCKSEKEKVKDEIASVLSAQEGTFAVAFHDLGTGDEILMNEHDTFHAASTMKTPVMIEVFKQAAEGRYSLQDSIVLKNDFKSIVDSSAYSLDPKDDSEYELYNQLGKKRTIASLVYEMITVSSNLSTNILIEMADGKKVTQTVRDLGAKDIQVRRGVEDQKAFEKKLNNVTTAYDLLVIFEKLANGEAVNPEASKAMVNILLDQKYNDIIPAQLPDSVKVAHKTGWVTGVHHDSAIVFLPDGRKYVLILLSKQLKDEKAGVEALSTVSKIIYNYVAQQKEE